MKNSKNILMWSIVALTSASPISTLSQTIEKQNCSQLKSGTTIQIPVSNPSFEKVENGAFTGWVALEHVSRGNYEFVSDTEKFKTAPSSLRIKMVKPELYGLLRQTIQIEDCWKGKTATLKGHLSIENANDIGGGLMIQAVQEGNGMLVWNHMQDNIMRGTSDWAPYSVSLKIPENAYYLRIGVMLQGGGTLWADDLTLEISN